MNSQRLPVFFVVLLAAALGGCATSRTELKLAPAPAPTAVAPSKGQTVVIRSVRDERRFEQAPSDPSTPSLGFEGADKASAEIKARAVGRKRNGYGRALGDVLLENGQTVAATVRDTLAMAFRQAGYDVRSAEAAGPAPLYVDVRITQFWAWMQPGFWAITLGTNIGTDIDISGGPTPTNVTVHAEESRQIAGDTAWLEIVTKALAAFRAEATAKLAARGRAGASVASAAPPQP